MEQNGIKVSLEIEPEDLPINVDKEQIEQVLINLIKNSIQAGDENDELKKDKIISISAFEDDYEKALIKVKTMALE